jgi:hypothetical protein
MCPNMEPDAGIYPSGRPYTWDSCTLRQGRSEATVCFVTKYEYCYPNSEKVEIITKNHFSLGLLSKKKTLTFNMLSPITDPTSTAKNKNIQNLIVFVVYFDE